MKIQDLLESPMMVSPTYDLDDQFQNKIFTDDLIKHQIHSIPFSTHNLVMSTMGHSRNLCFALIDNSDDPTTECFFMGENNAINQLLPDIVINAVVMRTNSQINVSGFLRDIFINKIITNQTYTISSKDFTSDENSFFIKMMYLSIQKGYRVGTIDTGNGNLIWYNTTDSFPVFLTNNKLYGKGYSFQSRRYVIEYI